MQRALLALWNCPYRRQMRNEIRDVLPSEDLTFARCLTRGSIGTASQTGESVVETKGMEAGRKLGYRYTC